MVRLRSRPLLSNCRQTTVESQLNFSCSGAVCSLPIWRRFRNTIRRKVAWPWNPWVIRRFTKALRVCELHHYDITRVAAEFVEVLQGKQGDSVVAFTKIDCKLHKTSTVVRCLNESRGLLLQEALSFYVQTFTVDFQLKSALLIAHSSSISLPARNCFV